MVDTSWDVIIVGQGLAGTTLAWHLIEAGQRVLMLDADALVTSSKIAAGLMTPITGKRLSLSWQYDTTFPYARQFYTGLENRTGHRFFYNRRGVRLFLTDTERQQWAKKSGLPAFQTYLVAPQPLPLLPCGLRSDNAQEPEAGFAMETAQLDVATFLAASRAALSCQTVTLDWQRDVAIGERHITVAGHQTRWLISCEGFKATTNPYFAAVPFRAAKGEILTVRFDKPLLQNVYHRGVWVAPTRDAHVFKVGSTYDWAALDQVPSQTARDEIEHSLRALFRVPYVVIDHQAAVRPIIHQSRPVVGMHPIHSRLGYFNGLGSKGSLLAPGFARGFTQELLHGTPIPDAIAVQSLLGAATQRAN
jgi:glycine oxidase